MVLKKYPGKGITIQIPIPVVGPILPNPTCQ